MNLKRLLRPLYRSFCQIAGLRIAWDKYNPRLTEARVYQNYLPSGSAEIIFDVGANIGKTSIDFANEFPNARIFSFEPFLENYNALVSNTRKISRIVPSQVALSDRDEVQDILRDAHVFSEWNSLEPATQAALATSGKGQVEKSRS